MKAWDIIRNIRSIDDERSTKILEDMFIFAYLKGINKGYDNALKINKRVKLIGDVEEAKKVFREKYL